MTDLIDWRPAHFQTWNMDAFGHGFFAGSVVRYSTGYTAFYRREAIGKGLTREEAMALVDAAYAESLRRVRAERATGVGMGEVARRTGESLEWIRKVLGEHRSP